MKTLVESLFDRNTAIKDIIFDNNGFKRWINRPDILWLIYYYWADEFDDPLDDFYHDEWVLYKPYVDYIISRLNKSMMNVFQKGGMCWYKTNFDQYDFDFELRDLFLDRDEFESSLSEAIYEIHHKSTVEEDGVWMTWFRGGLPKGSSVKGFFDHFGNKFVGKLDGGLLLTNDDEMILLGFPKGTDKKILKLFGITR